MRKTMLVMAVGVTSALLIGCSTSNALAPSKNTTAKPSASASKPQLTLSNVHVSINDGQDLSVSLLAVNSTDKAIYIQPSDFAVTNGSTTLSPTSQSQIPSQIPANSKTNVTLTFNVKGQLSGTITPKLGFQPSGNEPEQFIPIGNLQIPVPKTTSEASSTSNTPTRSSSSNSTSTVNSTATSSTASHSYQSAPNPMTSTVPIPVATQLQALQLANAVFAHDLAQDKNLRIDFDHYDSDNGQTVYVIHVFDDMTDHTATISWFGVRADGYVENTVPSRGWVLPKDFRTVYGYNY